MPLMDAFKKAGNFCWDNIRGGRLTLLDALEKGDWGKAGKMLQENPEAADWDLQGPTPIVRKPLHVAAASGDFTTLSILLRPEFFKGDADVKDSEGKTPLMLAAREGYDLIVKAMIAKGADVNALDKNGNSAMSLAAGLNRVATMQLLHANGADVNGPAGGERPIVCAAGHDMSLPALKFLIANKADLDSPGRYNETPLQSCWNAPNWEGLHTLLQAGADPNRPDATQGAKLLCWTMRANNTEATEKLLKQGADPTAPTGGEQSVLDIAHAGDRNPVITAMIDRRVAQLKATRNTAAVAKEMAAGTSAAISVKPIKLKLA